MKSKLREFIAGNKAVLILFVLSTAFFLYQHHIALSWDFSSYVLNAKFWFAEGTYFELLRPPLMPFIIGILSFLGWRASEYAYIIIVSALFAYSSARLAKALKFSPAGFYALSLNAYLLSSGLINGTELLSLVFLELAASLLLEDKSFSGLFLGLSALSRYTGLALFPILFLHIKLKKIIKSLVMFGAVLMPWFIYNYIKFGNFFTSVADQYANNIFYRDYLIQPFKLSHFIQAQNILIPFCIIGVLFSAYGIYSHLRKNKKWNFANLLRLAELLKPEIIMFFLLAYSIQSYSGIPLKNARYLFNIMLPTFYFSYLGISWLAKKSKGPKNLAVFAMFVIFVLSIFSACSVAKSASHDTPELYNPAIEKLDSLNLSDCYLMSNSWVMLNYLGKTSAPSPWMALVNKSIEQGKIIVLFKHVGEPDYTRDRQFIESRPVLYEDSSYVILGSGECAPAEGFTDTYLQQVDSTVLFRKGHRINQNPCFIMFKDSALLEKTCNLMNFKGFKQDKYREYE